MSFIFYVYRMAMANSLWNEQIIVALNRINELAKAIWKP